MTNPKRFVDPSDVSAAIRDASTARNGITARAGGVINALSPNAAYAVAAAKTVEFVCALAGTWDTNLTA